MSRARNQTAPNLLSYAVGADDTMTDELLRPAPNSNQENLLPTNALSTKNKLATMNPKARQAVTKRLATNRPRTVTNRKPTRRELIEREDTPEMEDIDEPDFAETPPTPSPQKSRARAAPKARFATSKTLEESVQHKQPVRQSPRRAVQKVNGTHAAPQRFSELQSDGIDAAEMSETDYLIDELAPPVIHAAAPPVRARSTSQQPVSMTLNRHRRAGSTSSNEGRNPDPSLRRKLGELTTKFEALEIKYRKLHDVGIVDAKNNFDKLKTSSDEKDRISAKLIQSLKQELASQKEASDEVQSRIHEADSHKTVLANLRAQLAAAKKEISGLEDEKTELKAQLAAAKVQVKSQAIHEKQLNESKSLNATVSKQLSDAQRENANLQTKLAVARNASTDRQTPGSAIKGGAKVPVMKVMTTTAEAAAASQAAQSKMDLYGDLTGLLVSNVERRSKENVDVFDCIQTGRNGTLHFKLYVSTDPAEQFDEAEFTYVPQLDAARDKHLMEILPDYFLDELSFPREQALQFYARVFDTLTRKHDGQQIEDEGEDEEEVEE